MRYLHYSRFEMQIVFGQKIPKPAIVCGKLVGIYYRDTALFTFGGQNAVWHVVDYPNFFLATKLHVSKHDEWMDEFENNMIN